LSRIIRPTFSPMASESTSNFVRTSRAAGLSVVVSCAETSELASTVRRVRKRRSRRRPSHSTSHSPSVRNRRTHHSRSGPSGVGPAPLHKRPWPIFPNPVRGLHSLRISHRRYRLSVIVVRRHGRPAASSPSIAAIALQTISKSDIIPVSSCSRLWQCKTKRPRCGPTRTPRRTVSPGQRSTVSLSPGS